MATIKMISNTGLNMSNHSSAFNYSKNAISSLKGQSIVIVQWLKLNITRSRDHIVTGHLQVNVNCPLTHIFVVWHFWKCKLLLVLISKQVIWNHFQANPSILELFTLYTNTIFTFNLCKYENHRSHLKHGSNPVLPGIHLDTRRISHDY